MPDPKTLDEVSARAAAVAAARGTLRRELAALRRAIVAADDDGHGRNEIARKSEAEGGLSRKMVLEALSAADLYTEAKVVLDQAGFGEDDYMLTVGQKPTLALSSVAGEDSRDPGAVRRRLADQIVAVLEKACIGVSSRSQLAKWENVTLTRLG